MELDIVDNSSAYGDAPDRWDVVFRMSESELAVMGVRDRVDVTVNPKAGVMLARRSRNGKGVVVQADGTAKRHVHAVRGKTRPRLTVTRLRRLGKFGDATLVGDVS